MCALNWKEFGTGAVIWLEDCKEKCVCIELERVWDWSCDFARGSELSEISRHNYSMSVINLRNGSCTALSCTLHLVMWATAEY